jgi:hypothetical protein
MPRCGRWKVRWPTDLLQGGSHADPFVHVREPTSSDTALNLVLHSSAQAKSQNCNTRMPVRPIGLQKYMLVRRGQPADDDREV